MNTHAPTSILAPMILSALLTAQSQFEAVPRYSISGSDGLTTAIAIGDLDNDGVNDIVWSANDSIHVAEYSRESGRMQRRGSHASSHAVLFNLFDFDADGDLDILALLSGVTFGNVVLLENRGNDAGRLLEDRSSLIQVTTDSVRHIASGDLDMDGDLDVIVSTNNDLIVFENEGAGQFTRNVTRICGLRDLALADLDGDDDLDAVGLCLRRGWVQLENRAGSLSYRRTLWSNSEGLFGIPRVGDIDGDGNVDLLMSANGLAPAIARGRADGTFEDPQRVQLGASMFAPYYLTDYDQDGDLDISTSRRMLRNDGGLSFSIGPPMSDVPILTPYAIGDIDADGDDDFARFELSQPPRVLVNLQHQLEAPYPPVLGSEYVVDAYARSPVTGGGSTVMIPCVQFHASGNTPTELISTPFGLLGLNPVEAIALPPIAVSQAVSRAAVRFSIPSDHELFGSRVSVQALVTPSLAPESWTLTNVLDDVWR